MMPRIFLQKKRYRKFTERLKNQEKGDRKTERIKNQ